MSIGLLFFITLILTVCCYILFVECPALKRAERAARKRERNIKRAQFEEEQRQLTDLYIDTFILEG